MLYMLVVKSCYATEATEGGLPQCLSVFVYCRDYQELKSMEYTTQRKCTRIKEAYFSTAKGQVPC